MFVDNPFVKALQEAQRNDDPNQEQLYIDWQSWNYAFLDGLTKDDKANPFGYWEGK